MHGPWDIGAKVAGVHASAAPWFKRRDIAVFGSDGKFKFSRKDGTPY
jgi:hypothetical protein